MNRVVILLILLARCMGDASLANGRVSLESLLFSGLQSPNGSETRTPTPDTTPTRDQTHSNRDDTAEISTSGGPTSSQPTISTEVTGKTVETPGATNSGIATTVSDGSGVRVPGDSINPDVTKERDGAHGSESSGPEISSEHSSASQEGENSSGPGVPTVLPKTSGQASSDGDGVVRVDDGGRMVGGNDDAVKVHRDGGGTGHNGGSGAVDKDAVRAVDGGLSAGGSGVSDNVRSVGGNAGDNGGSGAVNNENKGIGSSDETGTKANTQTTDKGSNIQKSFQIWYTAVPSVILFQEMRRP